jgi:hypothetical protein
MMPTMSISEKIKSEGRARKAPSSAMAAASDSDVPGPSITTALTLMGSPAPPAAKIEKPKKKGTAVMKKRLGPKPKAESMSEHAPFRHYPMLRISQYHLANELLQILLVLRQPPELPA